jgi:hypothetical protein
MTQGFLYTKCTRRYGAISALYLDSSTGLRPGTGPHHNGWEREANRREGARQHTQTTYASSKKRVVYRVLVLISLSLDYGRNNNRTSRFFGQNQSIQCNIKIFNR